jgi:photosystem II stability/assembly factor-like uncharacterized protein
MKIFYTLPLLIWAFIASAQPSSTSAEERIKHFAQRKTLVEQSIVNEVPFQNIGPSVFSGRVVDIDVSLSDPSHFYVAYASGGVWKTENNGITFTPLFDQEMVMTVGDIAVNWSENIIWIGTGENNSSRSSYAGVGVFKSTDGGKTWQHKGLEESHHISRVVLHPTNPNIIWVAVLGHLYSSNSERGIYKTTDGGNTWTKTLYVNDDTGTVDLVIDPTNPNTLYASTWERTRRAWDFTESGSGSGIHKSTDGGQTWQLLTNGKNGFPVGEGVGRIGLDIATKDGKTVLYTILDNYFRRAEEDKTEEGLTKNMLRNMSKQDFLKMEEKEIAQYLEKNNFPKEYTAKKVMAMVQSDEIQPVALAEYLEDANSLLFDTPVIGAEVYRSDDNGNTWKKMHNHYLDNVYNSYGYYFGQIRINPADLNKIYILGVPVLRSDDAGKTWMSIDEENVHADHHALWANPNRMGHLILGNDGGVNISYDDGKNWIMCNRPPVGQFYYIAVDNATPYNVYGGLQDNGVWMGPSNYKASTRWQADGQYPYKRIMGGDGMQVAIDTRTNTTVYTGFQFGNYFRINTATGQRKYITPKHKLGERPLRWNWQTPIHLSSHNQDILYMGSNKVHRSFNKGDDFETISEDLTTGGRKGDVAFSTLTTIHESPLKFGLLYVGSDDGLVHVSKDGGNSWTNISEGLPAQMWVARIQASQHHEATVYVALNAYRWDNFQAMVYKSIDYGKTWQAIGTDLPLEPVNVIKEDPSQPNILYVGTDHGVYVSLNGGVQFMAMNKNVPAVAVHDIVIHATAKEMLVGTHGRSIYKASVKELQALDAQVIEKELAVFAMEKIKHNKNWGDSSAVWMEANIPEVMLPFYVKTAGAIQISLHPSKNKNLMLANWSYDAQKGLNYAPYHLNIDEKAISAFEKELNQATTEKTILKAAKNGNYYLPKGSYTFVLTKGKNREEIPFSVE